MSRCPYCGGCLAVPNGDGTVDCMRCRRKLNLPRKRRMVRLPLLALLAASLSGCAPDLAAVANDKNSLYVAWQTPWGSGVVSRNMACPSVAGMPIQTGK